jgi:hypothetical protein
MHSGDGSVMAAVYGKMKRKFVTVRATHTIQHEMV